MKRSAINARDKFAAIKRKFLSDGLPASQRNGIKPAQFKAGTNHQQQCLARQIENSNRLYRMMDSASQNCCLPRQPIVLEKPLAGDQLEMQMNMDDQAARFIKTKEARHCRMVPACNGWKKLEAAFEQNFLGLMLILFCNEQIEIAVTEQYGIDTPPAFPIAVRNVLAMEIVEQHLEQIQDRALRTCINRRVLPERSPGMMPVHVSHRRRTLNLNSRSRTGACEYPTLFHVIGSRQNEENISCT